MSIIACLMSIERRHGLHHCQLSQRQAAVSGWIESNHGLFHVRLLVLAATGPSQEQGRGMSMMSSGPAIGKVRFWRDISVLHFITTAQSSVSSRWARSVARLVTVARGSC